MLQAACPFCDHEQIERQLLAETRDFYVVADRRPIRAGHVLFIPRRHIACFGELPPELDEPFRRLKQEVASCLAAEYGAPVFFEHGVAGQTVFHAHLHALPGGPDLLAAISPGRTVQPAGSLDDVRAWYQARGPYLYWEGPRGAHLLSPENVRPAFFWRVFAEAGAHEPPPPGAARELQARWQRYRVANGQRQIDVVTCFLWRAGRVCIFKRSEQVGSAQGKWHGVSGYLPEGVEPAEHASLEIAQETGLSSAQLGPARAGSPLVLGDPTNGPQWRVFPFLFEVRSGEPRLNWEHTELAWVLPAEMRRYDCVRWLPGLFDRLWAEVN